MLRREGKIEKNKCNCLLVYVRTYKDDTLCKIGYVVLSSPEWATMESNLEVLDHQSELCHSLCIIIFLLLPIQRTLLVVFKS